MQGRNTESGVQSGSDTGVDLCLTCFPSVSGRKKVGGVGDVGTEFLILSSLCFPVIAEGGGSPLSYYVVGVSTVLRFHQTRAMRKREMRVRRA
jgi:hypothetical protein